MRRFFLVFILSFFGTLFMLTSLRADSYRYVNYGIEDGLCDEYATRSFMDKDGYLWICTSNGLDRFDGNRFVHFSSRSSDPSTRIPNDFVNSVTQDSFGRIWGVSNHGAFCVDLAQGKVISPNEIGDSSGALSQALLMIEKDADSGLLALSRDGITRISLNGEGKISDIRYFSSSLGSLRYMTLQDDLVWVGGFEGLECYRRNSSGLVSLPMTDFPSLDGLSKVSTILCSGDYLWVGTEDGLFCYNSRLRTTESFRHDPINGNSVSDNHITSLASELSGDILIGTPKGVDRYMRGGRFEHISDGGNRRSLDIEYVNHILCTADGTMWVSTLVGGINAISPGRVSFENPLSVTEGSANIISCVFEDREGVLLAGILGKGLGIYRKDEMKLSIHSLKENGGISQDDIFKIRQDKRGDYWIASRNDGVIFLSRTDIDNPRFMSFSSKNHYLESDVVLDLEYDQDRDLLWLCTNHGLELMDPVQKKVKAVPVNRDEDYGITLNCLYIEGNHLWAGGTALVCLDLENSSFLNDSYHIRRFPAVRSASEVSDPGRINSIVRSLEGDVYIGTQNGGVFMVQEEGTYKPLPLDYGEFNGRISKLLLDSSGHLWIGSVQGVYNYNPTDRSITHFGKEDGIASANCYIGSGMKMSDGGICFGTANGLLIFDAPLYGSYSGPRRVLITGIVHDGKLDLRNQSRPLDIYSRDLSFGIRFSSLDLSDSGGMNYAYRMEPADKDWHVSASGSAEYSNMKPGRYLFRVKSIQGYEDTGGEETILHIKVHPPFFRTFWFWWILSLFVLSIIVSYLIQRSRQQKKEKKRLEEQVAEKTADLRKALSDILLSRESIQKQNRLLEEQTERLEQYAAREERVAKEKVMFLTNMTHELKTPLSLIIGPANELESSLTAPKDKTAVRIIIRNAKNLLSIVSQMLNLRKVDEGQVALNHERFDISRISDPFVVDYGRVLKERDIVLEKYERLVSREVVSDRDILGRILSNLVSNAVKYTPDGGRIRLYMAQFPSSDGLHAKQFICVSNSGSYIPPEERDKIFECFYRIPGTAPSASSGQGSSGIGLYVVKQLVSSLDGEISVKSDPVTGTAFRVLFPVELSPSFDAVEDEGLYPPVNQRDLPTLLLVEDNPDMRNYIRSFLEEGFNVAEAPDGVKGYEMAKKIIPDFIISDLMMPLCDGVELCRLIRSDSNLSHIPFLMLTALSDDSARLESYKCGADAFLSKPFEKEVLLARIDNILKNRKARQSELSFDLSGAYAAVNIENSDKAFMRNLLSIMKENYTDPEFNVPQMQTRMCMSMTPFYKKITALTGLTPALFIRLYRLQTAKKILEDHKGDSGISVSEVAYMVGFNDPKYFTKCFHKQFGILPSSVLQGGRLN
ncbi:MAG: response regulator [Bacteroidales bacterium]|nr:response regulator [Bacteroidales bacterium]